MLPTKKERRKIREEAIKNRTIIDRLVQRIKKQDALRDKAAFEGKVKRYLACWTKEVEDAIKTGRKSVTICLVPCGGEETDEDLWEKVPELEEAYRRIKKTKGYRIRLQSKIQGHCRWDRDDIVRGPQWRETQTNDKVLEISWN